MQFEYVGIIGSEVFSQNYGLNQVTSELINPYSFFKFKIFVLNTSTY